MGLNNSQRNSLIKQAIENNPHKPNKEKEITKTASKKTLEMNKPYNLTENHIVETKFGTSYIGSVLRANGLL